MEVREMELKEVFNAALEKFREEREKKEKRDREIEEFLNHVYSKLRRDEAAIISVPGCKTRIIVADRWIGIEDPSTEDPSLPPMKGFTCIPKSGKRYKEYIRNGLFREILMRAVENPKEARIEIIEVSHEIIAELYINEYRQISASDE